MEVVLSHHAKQPRQKRTHLNAFALYLMTLAGMITLYAVYAKFLVPLIEGPPNVIKRRVVAPNVEPDSFRFDKTQLTKILPEDAWEHGECKTLLTPQGTILFKNFDRVGGSFIDVYPFTLIASNGEQASEENSDDPITVLRCGRHARLKFDKSIAEAFAGKAKMASAQLVGEVQIIRPASGPNSHDALLVTTSNVQIEKQRIFTIEQVEFNYGNSHGGGRNLSIELAHESNVNEISGDFSSIRGIRRIELAFVDHLRFEPAKNSLEVDPSNDSEGDSSDSPLADLEDPINVRCQGPFVFDLETRTAKFRDSVVVDMENEFRDQILCDSLEMVFIREKNALTPDQADRPGEQLSQLKLHKIAATGKPAIAFSPVREAKLECAILSYFADLNRIVVEQSEEFANPIVVVSPEYHVVTQRLAYQTMDDGSLGSVDSTGPGKVLRVANDDDQKELFLQWEGKLAVRPQNNQKVLSILGQTKIRYDKTTHIDTGRLDFWLDQERVMKVDQKGESKLVWDYKPAKLVAHNNVRIQSDQLNGTTNRLMAQWIPSDASNDQNVQRNSGTRQLLVGGRRHTHVALRPRTANSQDDWIEKQSPTTANRWTEKEAWTEQVPASPQQTFVAQTHFQEAIPNQPKTKQKFDFRGDSVELKLQNKKDRTEVKELYVQGNVEITEVAKPDAKQTPLVVTGGSLRVVPQSEKMVRMLVGSNTQQQAKVDAPGLQLTGKTIHLDQQANKLWVEGTGQLALKKTDTAPTARSSSNSSNVASPKFDDVEVAWRGGMIFDGLKIYFEQSVEMQSRGTNEKGNLVAHESQCDALSLKLRSPINFQELESEQRPTDVEVDNLVIVDHLPSGQNVFQLVAMSMPQDYGNRPPARITSLVSSPAGEVIERQEFRVSQATIDANDGNVSAKGPGVIMQYRKGRVDFSKAGNRDGVAEERNRTEVPTTEGIALIRVNFDGTANANTNQSRLLIRGNVRTLYAPVDSFEKDLDPDQLVRLPDDSIKLTCEQLQLDEWSPRNSTKPTKEIIASGNAQIFSNTFEAVANRVSYNESSDILVIEGTPRSDARLSYSQTPTAARQKMVAGKILYRISDKWAEAQGVKNINLSRQ